MVEIYIRHDSGKELDFGEQRVDGEGLVMAAKQIEVLAMFCEEVGGNEEKPLSSDERQALVVKVRDRAARVQDMAEG